MLLRYTFHCKSCNFYTELLKGAYSMPFDLSGKMWAYKLYICKHCNSIDSRYVPSSLRFNCRCHKCDLPMQEVKSTNDFFALLCPACKKSTLEIKGHVERFSKQTLQKSA